MSDNTKEADDLRISTEQVKIELNDESDLTEGALKDAFFMKFNRLLDEFENWLGK